MNFGGDKHRVGELRPSQLLLNFGIGAVVDLPNISVMVMGLDDWDTNQCLEIGEERLRHAVQRILGAQVKQFLAPPFAPETGSLSESAFGGTATIGVPVAAFPRWMVCPYCRLLAPLDSGLFQLKVDPFRVDRTRYVHQNCRKQGLPPTVLPARFLVACTRGHLDDFPWVYFVHKGPTDCQPRLRLRELGVSGEAADVLVTCEVCTKSRSLSDAFGEEARVTMPLCRGRRPHLRDYDEEGCTEQMRTILLGASNSWFPIMLSALSVPAGVDMLSQLVEAHWHILEKASSKQVIEGFRLVGLLPQLSNYSLEEIWATVELKQQGGQAGDARPMNLKSPEWHIFTHPEQAPSLPQFRVTPAPVPERYQQMLSRIVLVERLRAVSALIGFMRIESPGDFDSVEEIPDSMEAPLSRRPPRWVPASEVHGEGIFLQFDEAAIERWLRRNDALGIRKREFMEAHYHWRKQRHLEVKNVPFPGLRYVLLHSFAHALIQQLALECGYSAASLRERIYSLPPEDEDGPMAGVLIYTAAPDSEGTLGGLVSLGTPEQLGDHLDAALERMRWCASDPLCAEHTPLTDVNVLHAAACHACLFVPETSCEHGNKFLDRSVLISTVEYPDLAFFPLGEAEGEL